MPVRAQVSNKEGKSRKREGNVDVTGNVSATRDQTQQVVKPDKEEQS